MNGRALGDATAYERDQFVIGMRQKIIKERVGDHGVIVASQVNT
ncbi:hypothetical protein Tter_2781 [Thermobaculum terrenum ATCC BAA-798]|uniref:Uncharacterized protein n=1 Tax=Thermobaculum terrenum (strain ATCC BAA-798 / CCMEE 7001 / YNP1) TaxID=525904 RepID=D1CIU6_THET1|nr:hypothetical protein [Thermobaculum terrenum]ACZ43666.1 hypothetical protein Tter_2781 [Thermobaculum terrenum ATCC BAA-798]